MVGVTEDKETTTSPWSLIDFQAAAAGPESSQKS